MTLLLPKISSKLKYSSILSRLNSFAIYDISQLHKINISKNIAKLNTDEKERVELERFPCYRFYVAGLL